MKIPATCIPKGFRPKTGGKYPPQSTSKTPVMVNRLFFTSFTVALLSFCVCDFPGISSFYWQKNEAAIRLLCDLFQKDIYIITVRLWDMLCI